MSDPAAPNRSLERGFGFWLASGIGKLQGETVAAGVMLAADFLRLLIPTV